MKLANRIHDSNLQKYKETTIMHTKELINLLQYSLDTYGDLPVLIDQENEGEEVHVGYMQTDKGDKCALRNVPF